LCYCLPVFFFFGQSARSGTSKILIPVLVGLFVIGTFVTGSRSSVIGNAGILFVAGLLLVVRGGLKALAKVIIPVMIGITLLGLIQSQYPEFFAAYHARVIGTPETSHAVEMEKRILGGLLGWTDGLYGAPPSLLGYGLGVMSNGSDKLSAYAAHWREDSVWSETDQATTFFEGGWYLVLVWYGFRFWIILRNLKLVLKLRRAEFRVMGFFAWGFIAVIGLTGTLAIQPPLAIWWWLAVGLVTCLVHFDRKQPKSRQMMDANLLRTNPPLP
jgi:hypothetical protein